MADSNSNVHTGGISFSGLLGILFIGLKLAGIIDWPWLWVLCPLWLPLAIVLAVVVACLLVGALCHLVAMCFK